jgi:hypothetical protein
MSKKNTKQKTVRPNKSDRRGGKTKQNRKNERIGLKIRVVY